jgi:nitrogenase iron protein NifH
MIPAVTDMELRERPTVDDIVVRAKSGVDCVEAGGPAAGVGCGGRAITRMLEIFRSAELLSEDRYDTVVFDVLGDVVCGGFAAPLKRGVGHKVVIVASEEVMALYAANNIAKAVINYGGNGIVLAGMIVNLRDNDADRTPIERFARLLGTRIIAWIPRDPTIREAEYRGTTGVELAPHSKIAQVFRDLAHTLLTLDVSGLAPPTPMDDLTFYEYTRNHFEELPNRSGAAAALQEVVAEAPAPHADEHEDDFRYELAAGMRAVREGLVDPEEALERLREIFPARARSLATMDLLP